MERDFKKQLDEAEDKLGLVDELQREIDFLKKENHKLRNSVYIPKKHDKTDAALAEFINGRPEND